MSGSDGSLSLRLGGEIFRLLPERAVWWEARRWLLVADTHWGKDEVFRAQGIPLPGGLLDEGLTTLGRLIERWGAEAVWVLGDLIHHPVGLSDDLVAAVAAWRSQHALPLHLVPGNHDRWLGGFPSEWGLTVQPEIAWAGGIALTHDPVNAPSTAAFTWAGHLHPTASAGRGRAFRFPCFAHDERVGVLPAFTTFSGGPRIPRHWRRYITAEGAVHPLQPG